MAEVEIILSNRRLVGMDTSPFIYYFERHPTYFPIVSQIVNYVEQTDAARLVTSSLTLLETTVFPLRNGRSELVAEYHNALTKTHYLSLIDLSLPVVTLAAELRAQYNLRTPDALQVAACISQQADVFVTNDNGLRRVKEIEVLLLDDFIESNSTL